VVGSRESLRAVPHASPRNLSRRSTGRSERLGYDFPVVGLGGFGFTKYVGGEGATDEQRAALCTAAVEKAIEIGCTYIDVAPAYGGGDAERLLGPALAPHREKFFLGCKTGEFRKSTAAAVAQMENSLKVLQTSYFDLFQFHAVTTDDDVDKILQGTRHASTHQPPCPRNARTANPPPAAATEGGALEAVKEARSQGKVRAIGFSAHDEAAALRLIRSDEFDTVMFPLNFFSHTVGGVGHEVLMEAKARVSLPATHSSCNMRRSRPSGVPGHSVSGSSKISNSSSTLTSRVCMCATVCVHRAWASLHSSRWRAAGWSPTARGPNAQPPQASSAASTTRTFTSGASLIIIRLRAIDRWIDLAAAACQRDVKGATCVTLA
jgi:aryl-alcohol dehydrogenase-like predicted oxidoreductase